MKKPTVVSNIDPLDVNGRLYRQMALLLDQLERGAEEISLRERIAALIAVGRVQTIFMGLRKENRDEPNAGTAVRRYAKAFEANAIGKRKAASRSSGRAAPAADPTDDFSFDDATDDDDTAA